jgi:hypothetical protein
MTFSSGKTEDWATRIARVKTARFLAQRCSTRCIGQSLTWQSLPQYCAGTAHGQPAHVPRTRLRQPDAMQILRAHIGSKQVVEWLKKRARSVLYTRPLPCGSGVLLSVPGRIEIEKAHLLVYTNCSSADLHKDPSCNLIRADTLKRWATRYLWYHCLVSNMRHPKICPYACNHWGLGSKIIHAHEIAR